MYLEQSTNWFQAHLLIANFKISANNKLELLTFEIFGMFDCGFNGYDGGVICMYDPIVRLFSLYRMGEVGKSVTTSVAEIKFHDCCKQ